MAYLRGDHGRVPLPLLAAGRARLRSVARPSGDVVLRNVIVYGVLMFYSATIYVGTLALAGVSGNAPVPWWLNLIALLIIVLTLWPVRGWLRRGANQIVYGQHD